METRLENEDVEGGIGICKTTCSQASGSSSCMQHGGRFPGENQGTYLQRKSNRILRTCRWMSGHRCSFIYVVRRTHKEASSWEKEWKDTPHYWGLILYLGTLSVSLVASRARLRVLVWYHSDTPSKDVHGHCPISICQQSRLARGSKCATCLGAYHNTLCIFVLVER